MGTYFAAHKNINFLNPDSQKVFRELVEKLTLGIFMGDAQNKLFYVNKVFNETFGFLDSSQSSGKDWSLIIFPDEELRKQFFAQMNKKNFVKDYEIVYVNSSGQKVFLALTAKYIWGDGRDIIGIQGVLADLSERVSLEEKLIKEHQKLEQMLTMYNTLADIFQIDELAKYIVSQTAQILDAQRCSLMFLSPNAEDLYIKAASGINDDIIQSARIKIGGSVAGIVALGNSPILVDNIEYNETFKNFRKNIYSHKSFMSAPVIYQKKLLGIINVSESNGRFSPIDLKVLETIAQQSAINIHKIEAMSTFEHLSVTDQVTGLFNFRGFIQRLEEEINKIARYPAPLSIMMIDLDNFKAYNDKHGHPRGNKLLKDLADVLRNNLRLTDYISRYGGDEFGVILPNTDSIQSAVVGEKLRELVMNRFTEDNVSLSIGIAQSQGNTTKDELIKQADEALYRVKRDGRNRVLIWKELAG